MTSMYLSSTVLLILLCEFTKADTFGHFGKSTPTYVHFLPGYERERTSA